MKRHLLALLLIAMLMAGCAPASKSAAPSAMEDYAGYAPQMEMAQEEMMESASSADRDGFGQSGNASTVERIVIKNASISIVVDDPAATLDQITRMAETMGGFVINSNLYKTYIENGIEVPAANISVRVPAEQLKAALEEIKSMVENQDTDIQNETVSGQDVTEDYTDLKSRLRNLEDAEAQLREIMASATKTEDVLSVFNQLTRVREEIEVLQGQINYYEESARLSSISVNIVSKEAVKPLTIGGWEPVGVARDALQALINGLQFLANALIWILLFVAPILLLITLPIFFIVRAVLRRRNKRKSEKKSDKPE